MTLKRKLIWLNLFGLLLNLTMAVVNGLSGGWYWAWLPGHAIALAASVHALHKLSRWEEE